MQLGKTHFVLVLKILEDGNSTSDFDKNSLMLYARTEEDCRSWVSYLKYAAHRKLENHYKIGPLIGEGGFAKVRLGRCVLSGEARAIKTMKKSEAHAKLFGTEIAIIKRVKHPNIVQTFDVYETSTHIHIVMEYMEGGMLYDAIEDGVRFSECDIAQFMRELLDGIMYLHNHGIVHRDIKPENVLCTSQNTPLHVKIADFGLSSIASVAGIKENHMLMSTIIGTPEFIAPEIANRQEYTEKVDMWALGMLCYNTICGQLPLDDTRDMIPQIQNGLSVTFPEPEWKGYSEYSRSFVKALLCAEPKKRLTPLACLVHPWLGKMKREESNKVGSYGRVSTFLLQQDPYPVFRSHRQGPPSSPSSNPVVPRFKTRADVKRWWIIAFLGVSAANRFDWLINSDRYDRAMLMVHTPPFEETSTSETMGSESIPSEMMSSVRLSGTSMASSFNDLDIANCGSETEDDFTSLQLSTTQQDTLASPQGEKPVQEFGVESRSSREDALSKKPNSWAPFLDQELTDNSSGDKVGPGTPKKDTLRKKIMSAFSSETEKRLAPVRRLSRKLSRRNSARLGEERKVSSLAPSPLERSQFDMDLADLNIFHVDESDARDLEDSEMSGPASWFGKEHKVLLNQSNKNAMGLSPLTPQKEHGNRTIHSSRQSENPITDKPNIR